jgi:hypothetical protein
MGSGSIRDALGDSLSGQIRGVDSQLSGVLIQSTPLGEHFADGFSRVFSLEQRAIGVSGYPLKKHGLIGSQRGDKPAFF